MPGFFSIKSASATSLLVCTLTSVAAVKYMGGYFDDIFPGIRGALPINDFYLKNHTELTSTNKNSDNKHTYFEKYNTNNLSSLPGYTQTYNSESYYPKYDFSGLTQEEQRIYTAIQENTIKISSPCTSGTAWILDFIEPKDNSYPLKWFIATNLHVINKYFFNSNPFDATLPRDVSHYMQQKKLKSLESLDYYRNQHLYPRIFSEDRDVSNCDESNALGVSYLSLVKQVTPINAVASRQSTVVIAHDIIEDPKLFYTAINFLGDRYTWNGRVVEKQPYYKDFAVLEINFKTETQAQMFTRDFYKKAHSEKNEPKTKPVINIFADELMKNKTHDQLAQVGNIYVGGYPGKEQDNLKFEINAKKLKSDSQQVTKSDLAYINDSELADYTHLINRNKQLMMGHADLNKNDHFARANMLMWNNTQLSGWGYNYLITNSFLLPGSSGSMAVTKEGDLLGLYRMYNWSQNLGYVEPIRSEGIVSDGKIIVPKYDLIKGTDEQTSSYKSQLDRYYARENSYLRTRNWQ